MANRYKHIVSELQLYTERGRNVLTDEYNTLLVQHTVIIQIERKYYRKTNDDVEC